MDVAQGRVHAQPHRRRQRRGPGGEGEDGDGADGGAHREGGEPRAQVRDHGLRLLRALRHAVPLLQSVFARERCAGADVPARVCEPGAAGRGDADHGQRGPLRELGAAGDGLQDEPVHGVGDRGGVGDAELRGGVREQRASRGRARGHHVPPLKVLDRLIKFDVVVITIDDFLLK